MTKLNLIQHTFESDGQSYAYSVGDWVQRDWQGGTVNGKIRDKTKDSYTVDGNTVKGDDGEPVYKMEEYKDGEFTGQMIAAPQSGLRKWSGAPQNNTLAQNAISMDFEMDTERVFSAWNSLTNMSEQEMEMWEKHPCSDVGVDNGESMRDNTMMLMGQAPDGWNEESYQVANRVVAWARKHVDDLEDNAGQGGRGTCPTPLAVHMLNRGINPFEEAPSGNPTFSNIERIETETLNTEFASDSDELDSVYSNWSDAVNMSKSQLESWADHPCSNEGSNDPQAVRKRNMRLLEKSKSDWTQTDIDDAKRTVSFISRMSSNENKPEDPKGGNVGTCPSEWAISLLNWAYNPFSGMPDGEPNPDEEQSDSDRGLVYDDAGDPLELSFGASALQEPIQNGFNQYGIKKNYENSELVSVDAVYEAMEPGPPVDRNGVRITTDFLKTVAQKDYSDRPPHMMDHRRDTLSHIGFVQEVWFSEQREKLMVKARTYNTGADTHDEIVKRLTHEPPALSDGSLGFGQSYEAIENDDGERELVDGKIQEFSTTPFPGGYDEGGLRVAGQAD